DRRRPEAGPRAGRRAHRVLAPRSRDDRRRGRLARGRAGSCGGHRDDHEVPLVIEIGDGGLTRQEYDRIVLDGEHVALEPGALARLQETRARMLAHVAPGGPACVITRGLGHLVGVPVSTDDQAELQASLLTARAAGFAEPLPPEIVRGAMVVRLAGFLHGPSRVSASLCQVIAQRLNESWSPVVPSGPFGAAGEI